MGENCLTCKHNMYINLKVDWFDCSHPTVIARGSKWQAGDPAIMNYRTADIPASRIDEIGECPTYEPVAALSLSEGGK